MFNSPKQPLLNSRRSTFSPRYILLLFIFGFIFTCALIRTDWKDLGENALGMGNTVAGMVEGEGAPAAATSPRSTSPDRLERGSPLQGALESADNAISMQDLGTTGRGSPSPNRPSSPKSPPQQPGKPGKDPVPPMAGTSSGAGPSSAGPGAPGIGFINDIAPGEGSPSGTTGLPPIPPLAPAAAPEVAPGPPVRCDDPQKGFAAKVMPCGNFYFNSKENPTHQTMRLTYNSIQIVYNVDNKEGMCKGGECNILDQESCCKVRQRCNPSFAVDVPGGCPATMMVNPYPGAFCKTAPCTIADEAMCCISTYRFPDEKTAALWQRTDLMRSKYARVEPDPKAAVVEPKISFGHNDIAWFDMTKKRVVGQDEWAPLVNFMSTFGGPTPGVRPLLHMHAPAPGQVPAWKTSAWLRVSENGKMIYKPAELEKVYKGQLQAPAAPAGSSASRADEERPDF
jgi:hypothetical protein